MFLIHTWQRAFLKLFCFYLLETVTDINIFIDILSQDMETRLEEKRKLQEDLRKVKEYVPSLFAFNDFFFPFVKFYHENISWN